MGTCKFNDQCKFKHLRDTGEMDNKDPFWNMEEYIKKMDNQIKMIASYIPQMYLQHPQVMYQQQQLYQRLDKFISCGPSIKYAQSKLEFCPLPPPPHPLPVKLYFYVCFCCDPPPPPPPPALPKRTYFMDVAIDI